MFAEDYEPDTRPMIMGFCVLCTQDLFKDREKVGIWPNLALTHVSCTERVLHAKQAITK